MIDDSVPAMKLIDTLDQMFDQAMGNTDAGDMALPENTGDYLLQQQLSDASRNPPIGDIGIPGDETAQEIHPWQNLT